MSDTEKVISDAMTVAGKGNTAVTLAESVTAFAGQIEQLRTVAQAQVEMASENTQAVLQNAVAQKSGGVASVAGNIAKSAAKTLTSGLSLSPLVSAIAGLFRSDKVETPQALPSYTAPAAVQFQGAISMQSGQAISAVDYGQDGKPRQMSTTAPFFSAPITIQVQALDSRSFMDHSDDIARAVREAILNAHSLGDTVSEL